MTPCLSESWAGVYLQVAAAILIFGVGLPNLVMQTIASEDVRRIIYRHRWSLERGFFFLLVLAAVTLIFVWFHPCDPGVTAPTVWGISADWWAAVTITLAVSALVLCWYIQVSPRRDGVLGWLKKKCSRNIRSGITPDEQTLLDIRYLGEQGKAGIDKTQALEVLGQLAEEVQGHKFYAGYGLEGIMEAIEAILREEANTRNFLDGISILRRIIITLQENADLSSPPDMAAVLRALGRVGILAVEADFEPPVRSLIEAAALSGQGPNGAFQDATRVILELGVAALKGEHFPLAVQALNKLEALVWPAQPLTAETSANYLGLVAHFWDAGPTARDRARMSIENLDFEPSKLECLQAAQKRHVAAARFDTADKLIKTTFLGRFGGRER